MVSLARKNLPHATPWLWNFIVIFVIFFVVLLLASPLIPEPWGEYAVTAGFSFLSVALALLVTEILLKDAFAKDLLSLTELRRRFRDIGLEDLSSGSNNGWERVTDGTRSLLVVLPRPMAWVDSESGALRELVESSGVSVTVSFADPSQFDSVMTQLHDFGESTYAADVALAVQRLTQAWNSSWIAHSGSSLTINYLDTVVNGSMIHGDRWVELSFPQAVGEIGAKPLVVKLKAQTESDVGRWVQNAIRAVDSATQEVPVWQSHKGLKGRSTKAEEGA